MPGRFALTYHPLYDGRGFSPVVASWRRYTESLQLITKLGLDHGIDIISPPLATIPELLMVHPSSHVAHVQALDACGSGIFDSVDTAVWPGVFDRARAAVGATLEAVRIINSGRATHLFNPGGGLHHASASRSRGFCIFNDIACAVDLFRRQGLQRVAVVDVDGHHGDGTQELLYDRETLHVSLHQYDGRFFPGTGSTDEVGWGCGYGLTVNVPLPRRLGDVGYLDAFRAIVPRALRAYQPDAIIVNFGVDGHYSDPLVKLRLGMGLYRAVAIALHTLAHELCGGKTIYVGSGGYHPETVARCWAMLVAELSGVLPEVAGATGAHIANGSGVSSASIITKLRDASAWPARLRSLMEPDPPSPNQGAIDDARKIVEIVATRVLPIALGGNEPLRVSGAQVQGD